MPYLATGYVNTMFQKKQHLEVPEVTNNSLKSLQLIQGTAAGFLTGNSKEKPHFTIDFKMLLLNYMAHWSLYSIISGAADSSTSSLRTAPLS